MFSAYLESLAEKDAATGRRPGRATVSARQRGK
jgi:hypothetical protein